MPFPWDEVIAHGLAVLRLHPDALWAMTPRELGAIAAGRTRTRGSVPPSGLAPPGRDELARLIEAFPDGR